MHTLPVSVSSNRFLQALPCDEVISFEDYLERIDLIQGDIIYPSGQVIDYVYFPENCLVSMITTFNDGSSIESGLIGHEGIVGACIALSNTVSKREAFVQISGQALRMKAARFRAGLRENKAFNQLVQKYIFAFIEQVAQIGACGNHHNLNERLQRLILMLHDCFRSSLIPITHESIAQMLSVHRPSVSHLAACLKEAGAIDYNRGVIFVKDRKKLEMGACECYRVIQNIYSSYNSVIENRIAASEVIKPAFAEKSAKEQSKLPVMAVYG